MFSLSPMQALCGFGTPRRFPHPAQDSSSRNAEAKHRQLAVNAWSASSWVLGNHTTDEFAQLEVNTFSSGRSLMSREPRPIQLEHGPVPANDGFGLYKNQRLLPSTPDPPQHRPEQSIRSGESRREQKKQIGQVDSSLGRASMKPVLHECG